MSGQAHEKKPNSPVTMNRPSPGMLSSAIAVAKPLAKKLGKARRTR